MRGVGKLAVGFAAVGLATESAKAQSQFEGGITSTTSMSLMSAVESLHNDAANAVAGWPLSFGAGAGASGRLRHTTHDGLTTSPNFGPPGVSYAFDIKEASAFGQASYGLGTVVGGAVRLSVIFGHNWLDLEAKPNSLNPLPAKGAIGSAENESFMAGGSLLWHSRQSYVSVVVLAHHGDTTLVDKFPGPGNFIRYNYDTAGVISNLLVGHVFNLAGGDKGVKLDLRGGLGYIRNSGSSFDVSVPPGPPVYAEFDFSAATASFSPMLFADIAMAGGILRPYVQGTVKTYFNYSNSSALYDATGLLQVFKFNEDKVFTSVELGLNFVSGSWAFGAGYTHEWSDDVKTDAGRLSAVYKFN
jgi:hypothetical protein